MRTRYFTILTALILTLSIGNDLKAQSTAPTTDILKVIQSMNTKDCSFLEVSEEMFQLMSQDERATPEVKDIFTKIQHVIQLNCIRNSKTEGFEPLFIAFEDKAKSSGFKLLMRSETKANSYHFFRRSKGENNEYILVGDVRIQYMATSLNITSIQQLTNIVNIAGDAGGL